MNILIALVPAVLWGCNPLWAHFCGGKPINNLLGATYGAFIVAALMFLIKRPIITVPDFWWCFFAGAGWSLAQLTQFTSFKRLGASTTTPISSGTQLVGVSLIGVLFFGSWSRTVEKVVGFTAVLLIILGVYLTTKTGSKNKSKDYQKKNTKYIIELILGSLIGFGACSTLPKIPQAQGWSAFPPQALGMLTLAVIIALGFKAVHHQKILTNKYTFRNVLTGLSTGLGTFGYLFSLMINNVSTAFTLSQMSIVVGTLGGLIILHEHKSPKALAYTLSGLTLVVIGGVMIGIFG